MRRSAVIRNLAAAFMFFVATAAANAQTATTYSPGSAISSSSVNAAFGSKADSANGTLTSPTITGGTLTGVTINTGSLTLSGTFQSVNGAQTVNTTYAGGGLTNGVLISSGGNSVSYCPVLSCVTSPSTDHQRASALFWSTTSDDGHSEEQTLAVQTIIQTGAFKPWTTSTAYAVGDNVNFQDARNSVYRATTAGTSAASGTGPTGKTSGITDGSVVWAWVNDAAINAKVGLYNEVQVKPGAGNTWAQANNVQLTAGVVPAFNINTEFDFQNNAADCAIGSQNCNNLEVSMSGTKRSTTGIHLTSGNTGATYAALWGIRLNGDKLASMADIEIDSSAPIGLGFASSGIGGAATHSTAAIHDMSTGLNAIYLGGTKTGSDINIVTSSPSGIGNSGTHSLGTFVDTSSSPIVISVSGTHSVEVFNDASTTPAAINLAGTYSIAAITTAGSSGTTAMVVKDNQKICFNNTDACLVHAVGKLFYQVGGVNMFSVADTTGNAIFKGTVTASGVP